MVAHSCDPISLESETVGSLEFDWGWLGQPWVPVSETVPSKQTKPKQPSKTF